MFKLVRKEAPPAPPPRSRLAELAVRMPWAYSTLRPSGAYSPLSKANLSEAHFFETFLSDVDLSHCKNLDTIDHRGPIRTLQCCGPLPLAFLRGVGLPDALIEYLPSLLGQAIQQCFISYSSKDETLVHRLHADLRCWSVLSVIAPLSGLMAAIAFQITPLPECEAR